jgi:hypothetical protein
MHFVRRDAQIVRKESKHGSDLGRIHQLRTRRDSRSSAPRGEVERNFRDTTRSPGSFSGGYTPLQQEHRKEVAWKDIVSGFEAGDGQYVVLTEEELRGANPKATKTIDIVEFVDGEDIESVFYDRPYYLEPKKKGSKAYALLRETLQRTGKVGIAKVVIRTRQHLAAVMVAIKCWC